MGSFVVRYKLTFVNEGRRLMVAGFVAVARIAASTISFNGVATTITVVTRATSAANQDAARHDFIYYSRYSRADTRAD